MLDTRQWKRFLARKELKAYKRKQKFLEIQARGPKFFAHKTEKEHQYEYEAALRQKAKQERLAEKKAKQEAAKAA